jgi:hypothetical protein
MGVPFIFDFRLRQFRRGKVCSSGTQEAPDGSHNAAKKSGLVVGARLHLVEFIVDFFFSPSFISRKNGVVKRSDLIDV